MKDDYVVRPITAGGWDYIAAALARLFGRLRATGEGHCVIVEVASATNHFVQYIVRADGGIWAEAVGDIYLTGGAKYDDDQRRDLELLRWNPPSETDGPGDGNYWREYEAPGHDLEAATIGVLTCVDVFRAGPRADVRVKAFEAAGTRG